VSHFQDGAAVDNGVFTIRLGTGAAAQEDSTCGEPSESALDFIAGPENRLAAVAVASLLDEQPSQFNPLVIYGPSGTGKTHLAYGLAQCWSARLSPARREGANQAGDVVYLPAIDFANDLTAAIDRETTGDFRARFRGASLLVIEDLTQLATRRPAQQELLHTLDAVVDRGGQVVATSRVGPAKISGFAPELCSRLTGGLAVPLLPPSSATRQALIQRLAASRGIALPAAAVRILADGVEGTAPELLGALLELHVQAELDGEPIDAARVRRWLAGRQSRLQPSLRTIARMSAKYFGLRVADLTSPSRRRSVVRARSVAMYLARQITSKSLGQLGIHFGGRDHTTVLHNYRNVAARVCSDPAIRRAVADIRKLLAQA
jgi:chromosomal replication initiator protein